MKRSLLVLSLGLFACGGKEAVSAPLDSEGAKPAATYAIHLVRPHKAGDARHVVHDDVSEDRTKTMRGAETVEEKTERTTVHYDARVTTLAVDARGRALRTKLEMASFTIDGKSVDAREILITAAKRSKDAEMLVDGKPATKEVRKAISGYTSVDTDADDDDAMMGTKIPQPIGGRWPVNAPLIREDWKDDSGMEPGKVTGESWLAGVTRVDGIDCLDLHVKLRLDDLRMTDLPGGETGEGRIDAEMQNILPIDPDKGSPLEHTTMNMSLRITVPMEGGPPIVVVLSSHDVSETHSKPL